MSLNVPANIPQHFQPLDLTANGPVNSSHGPCQQYVNEVRKEVNKRKSSYDIEVTLKFSILKPLHENWVTGLYDYLRSKRHVSYNSFKESGINEALTMYLDPEPRP